MSDDIEILLAALWKIANGTALSAYPGSKQPKALTKPEIHFIATNAYSSYHTIKDKSNRLENADAVAAWTASPEGKKSLEKTALSVKAIIEQANEDKKLDQELLRKPMDI